MASRGIKTDSSAISYSCSKILYDGSDGIEKYQLDDKGNLIKKDSSTQDSKNDTSQSKLDEIFLPSDDVFDPAPVNGMELKSTFDFRENDIFKDINYELFDINFDDFCKSGDIRSENDQFLYGAWSF
ncbi:hypothetical protein GPJ56_001780 [Histomonas meleagridis]|uniref:uncharacterized protein n=1 Tax=Histomonas meleagridis TaxID=135588 RepID=UPI00355A5BA7|nr:hypothetical protein GPJ56_001780 [Histomonas meleagridis]KAH0806554.1 hypothetical protein GO595_000716 [Histomonas meleagridis]